MNTRGLLEMTWQDTCFLHWPMAPDELATHLPDGLSPATYNGDAWVGVVAFEMAGISPRGLPVSLSFPELNLRTYVDGPSGPGVLFFNLDADDKLGVSVARRLFRLPYYQADGQIRRTDAGVTFASTRTHDGVPSAAFDVTYRRVGDSDTVEPGSLTAFLVENYRFYASGRRLLAGEINHDPWQLSDGEVDVRQNTLFQASDMANPNGPPIVHVADDIRVTAGRPEFA